MWLLFSVTEDYYTFQDLVGMSRTREGIYKLKAKALELDHIYAEHYAQVVYMPNETLFNITLKPKEANE